MFHQHIILEEIFKKFECCFLLFAVSINRHRPSSFCSKCRLITKPWHRYIIKIFSIFQAEGGGALRNCPRTARNHNNISCIQLLISFHITASIKTFHRCDTIDLHHIIQLLQCCLCLWCLQIEATVLVLIGASSGQNHGQEHIWYRIPIHKIKALDCNGVPILFRSFFRCFS